MRQLLFQPAARAQFLNLDRQGQQRIGEALERYARTGQGDIKRLHGPFAGSLRLRIGPFRVRLDLETPGLVRIYAIEKRGDAYRE